MSGEIVNVAYWESLFPNNFAPGITYYIHDSAQYIEGLPASEITGPLGAIVWTGATLDLDAAHASAILNAASNTAGDFLNAASMGGQVTLIDNADAVLALSVSDIQRLESIGFNSISIADTAGDIEKLDASQIQAAAARGVSTITVTSTNTSIALDAAVISALQNTAINLIVPTNDTVTVTDNAADIEKLTASQIENLAADGVTAIASDGSVVLGTLEATEFVEDAPNIKITAPTTDSVTLGDNATNLQELDPTVIAGLPNLGVTALVVNDDLRPAFDLTQEAAIAKALLTVNEPAGVVQLTVSQLPGYDFLSGTTYTILDTATDIDGVSAGALQALPPQVTLIESFFGPVYLNVAQALALENAALPINASTSVSVVDTAAKLEALSPAQLTALGFIGVTSVAASDTAPVFSPEQVAGLNAGSVSTVAPPTDPLQNVGTTVISGPGGPGKGLTFDIMWGPSVASAPAGYEAILEQAFQYYADTFSNPITLYYTIGFNRIDAGGINQPQDDPNYESYSALVAQMQANAQSLAQKEAVASLPASSPTGAPGVSITVAEALALGFTDLGDAGTSFANPADLNLEADNGDNYLYSTNPDQVPNDNQSSLLTTMEHEISEGMGRVSSLDSAGDYAPIDLFRFSAPDPNNSDPGNRALTPLSTPSYFSINDGVTDIADWNNHKTGTQGDLDDWAASAGNDAYSEYPTSGTVLAVTATDVTLMNVLGFNLAAPTETPTLPPLLNVLFFDGNDANGDIALWVSNGTAVDTRELIGVNNIAGDTVAASGITVFGSNVLFNGADLYGNDGLWISNGATWGTEQITGIANAASAVQGGLDPTDLTVVGNDVWFEGKDANGNVGLWETDGTAAGTNELVQGLIASNMTAYGNAVYFTGTDGGLWKTDGTPGGTIEIAGAPASSIGQFTPVSNLFTGDTLYLAGDTYNVTAPGPNSYPGGFNFDPSSFDVVNGELLFSGTVILQNETADQTPTWARLLFAWNGTSLQVLGPGLFDGGMVNGTGFESGVTYYAAPGYNGELVSSQAVDNLILYGIPDPSFQYFPNSTAGSLLYQTDGTAAGTTYNVVIGTPNGTTYIDGGSTGTISDLTSVDGSLLYGGINAGLDGGYDLWADSAGAPQTAVQITREGQVYQYPTTPDADLVSGVYDPYPTNANPTGEAYPNSLDLFLDAEPNSVGSGFNPTDMTVFDGNVYFSAVNAAGKTELWELVPNTPAEPFWEQTFNAGGSQAFLAASGLEFTGINGAYAGGFDPSNITALTIPRTTTLVPITEGQLLVDETLDRTNPGSATAPAGEGFVLTDTALDIESLTAAEITAGVAIGLDAIASTDASVVFTADMVEALEPSTYVMAPAGDTVTIADYAASIEGISDAQLSELTEIGVSAIVSTDASVVIRLDQALALTTPVIVTATADVAITAPLGATVSATGTAAQVDALSPDQIIALKSVGISVLTADGSVKLSVGQALALEDPILVTAPSGDTVTISDTAIDIEALTVDEIAALPGVGVNAIAATVGSLVLQQSQANEIVAAGLHVSAPLLDRIILADTATDVIAMTTAQIDTYASLGVTEIATSSGVTLSVAQVDEFEKDGISLVQGAGTHLSVTVYDTPAHIETLDPQQIDGLTGLSSDLNKEIFSTDYQIPNSTITLNVQQLVAYEKNAINIVTPVLAIEDSSDQIDALTPNEIAALGGYSTNPVSVVVDSPLVVELELDQALAIVGPNYSEFGTGVMKLTGSAAELPPGDKLGIYITDTAADFEKLTTAQIDTLGHFYLAMGSNAFLGSIECDASLVLNVAQAEEAAADNVFFSVPTIDPITGNPTGYTLSIGDSAAAIEGFLDLGALVVTEIISHLNSAPGITASSVITGLAANDGSVALSVSEAETLEAVNAALGTNLAISTPAGDTVTLSGMASDIAGMSPAQLGGLSSIGVTAIDVTDQSITLTVQQALALYDPVPISVPPGDTVYVADTEAAIASLTPIEVAGLAAIGVNTIEVSNLSGGSALTISGGITLAISGVVPANETITFAGTGGTLALSDDVAGTDAAGTIYGFSPPDTIDLTDVPYDATGVSEDISGAALSVDPADSDQAIIVTENSNPHYLDIDPSQVFLTTPSFELNPDNAGTGTDLTVVEPPVTDEYIAVSFGQTSDGIVIGSGGEVEADSGATVNRAIVQNGGELLGDVGSTINDTFIQSGGLLDLNSGSSGSGIIDFGPLVGDRVGGVLQIDDLYLPDFTITGIAAGDTIDLTADPYDPNGSANLVSGNVLDVTEDGSTYTLQFDPTQDFSGDYFHRAPDVSGNGTDITENATPCYCRGTLIATARGEVAVEELAIADEVVTMSGAVRPIKWIGRRSYGGRFVVGRKDVLPICIRAGALDERVPRRDLWISPHHAMYLDGTLIEAKDLVNGVSIVQAEYVEKVDYFHIELESHDVILAEGALSESFIDDDSRGTFQNAHEYGAMYPQDAAKAIARYCARRLDEGYELEALRVRLAARPDLGGLRDIVPRIGTLRGYVDRVSADLIEGWAQNVDHPEAAVCLDVYAGGRLIGQIMANRYRKDLECAGLGTGNHSFRFTTPDGLALAPTAVEVRRSLDQAILPVSERARKIGVSTAA